MCSAENKEQNKNEKRQSQWNGGGMQSMQPTAIDIFGM